MRAHWVARHTNREQANRRVTRQMARCGAPLWFLCRRALCAESARLDFSDNDAKKRGAKMRSTRLRWFGPRFFAFIGAMALALSVTVAASADTATKHVTFDHEAMIGGA